MGSLCLAGRRGLQIKSSGHDWGWLDASAQPVQTVGPCLQDLTPVLDVFRTVIGATQQPALAVSWLGFHQVSRDAGQPLGHHRAGHGSEAVCDVLVIAAVQGAAAPR